MSKNEDTYKVTINTWNKIASLYEEKFMDLDLYNESYDFLCASLSKTDASILELSCGPGNITQYLLNKIPTLKILATDISPEMLALAKKHNPKADFQILDIRSVHTLNQTFDAVVFGFGMPYISKPDIKNAFLDIKGILNQGGIFYCSTLEGVYEDSKYVVGSSGDKAFIYYYTPEFFKNLFTLNGFKIIYNQSFKYPRADQFETHNIIIGRKI